VVPAIVRKQKKKKEKINEVIKNAKKINTMFKLKKQEQIRTMIAWVMLSII